MSLPRSRTPWNPMRWNCQGSGRLRFARAGCTMAACCCRVTMPPNSIRRADQLPATQQAVQRAGFRPDPSATWQGWMLWDIVPFDLTYRPYRPNSNHISTDSQHRPRLGLHLPHTTTNHGPQHQGKQDRHALFLDPAFFLLVSSTGFRSLRPFPMGGAIPNCPVPKRRLPRGSHEKPTWRNI